LSFRPPEEMQHGTVVTDHSEEKQHWDGYWEKRQKKLKEQVNTNNCFQTFLNKPQRQLVSKEGNS
jgi:hypothetical protein